MKLYVYDHCPFCVKAMMMVSLKQQPCEIDVLLNDDIDTPTAMIGQKMVPILQKDDGSFMAESLDIIHYVDQLDQNPLVTGSVNQLVAEWLEQYLPTMQLLTVPRAARQPFPEFATEGARAFYTRAKTEWLGEFQPLIDNTDTYLEAVNEALQVLVSMIKGDPWLENELSETDFHLFAALRGLSGVKGILYPEKVEKYLKGLSERSNVPLLLEMAI